MKAYPKSRGNVTGITKLGANQRWILRQLRLHQCLRFSDLLSLTGLGERQVKDALRPLVKAQLLVYVWSKDGRAVYRLLEKGNNHGE